VAEALGGQPRPAATGAPPLTAAARRPSAGSAADLARDASGRVLLYYTDAHELRDDCCEYLYPFGKAALRAPGAPTAAGVADAITAASTFVFVSVRVANVERVLYVLPRPVGVHPVTLVLTSPPVPVAPMPDVQEEVTARLFDFTGHHRGRLPPSVAAKVVTRACPFGDAAALAGPAAYLKFKFSNASCGAFLPADAVGSTFPRVYGAKAGAAEALIHRRGLCGPGWVALEGAVEVGGCVTHAWVALEVDGDAAETAMAADAAAGPRLPTSTLLVLSLAVKTVVVPSGGGNEIAVIAGVYTPAVSITGGGDDGDGDDGGGGVAAAATRGFVLVRPPGGAALPFGFTDRTARGLASFDAVKAATVRDGAGSTTPGTIYARVPPRLVGRVTVTVRSTNGRSTNGLPFRILGAGEAGGTLARFGAPTAVAAPAGGAWAIDAPTAVAVGPDGRLYVGTLAAGILVADVDYATHTVRSSCGSGSVGAHRSILGVAFNPLDWVAGAPVRVHVATSTLYWGRDKRLPAASGWRNGAVEAYTAVPPRAGGVCLVKAATVVSGLPVSDHDHAVNGLAFNADGDLFIQVGGVTNVGLPSAPFESLHESVLSAATLKAETSKGPAFDGAVTYSPSDDPATAVQVGGKDVSVFASGLRNSLSVLPHSNGQVYATDNGTLGGGLRVPTQMLFVAS